MGNDNSIREYPPPEGCTCPPKTGFGQNGHSHIVGNPHCFIDRNYKAKEKEINLDELWVACKLYVEWYEDNGRARRITRLPLLIQKIKDVLNA